MRMLFEQDKIGAIGVSNFAYASRPLHIWQSPYNLFEREIEVDAIPCSVNAHTAIAPEQ
jgi:aryl-alcohol dehydrogenase-like predicted oxidoreductase